MPGFLAAERERIAREWLDRTIETYPAHTARFLLAEKDRFRNPVGFAFRQALPVLVEELLEGMDRARLAEALDGVVRIRAVQDCSAGESLSFLLLVKRVFSQYVEGDELRRLEGRVDQMLLLAFDLFMQCRERIHEIKAEEARRRIGVILRAAQNPPLER